MEGSAPVTTGATKRCPRCAEEIQAAAQGCRWCGADFEVTTRGYCTTCHRPVVLPGEATTCPTCGTEAVDVHVDTRLATASSAAMAPIAGAPLTAAPVVAAGVPAWAPVGEVRTALVASNRQVTAVNVTSAAAMILAMMPILGVIFDGLRIYERPSGIFLEYATLGPLFFVFGLLILAAAPRPVFPRRIGGSRMRARAGRRAFVGDVRSRLGSRMLYRAHGYTVRVVLMFALWLVSAVTFAALFSGPLGEEGVNVRAGTGVTIAVLAVGSVSALFALPARRQRTVDVDDEGSFVG